MFQVIDYKVHDPLHTYLQEHHSSTPFNAIFDVVGNPNQTFTSSTSYLTKTGTFLLLGAMGILASQSFLHLFSWLLQAQINRFLPAFLGGTPRRFLMFSANPGPKDLERILEMVQAGKIKPLVDSVWKLPEAKKVRTTPSQPHFPIVHGF